MKHSILNTLFFLVCPVILLAQINNTRLGKQHFVDSLVITEFYSNGNLKHEFKVMITNSDMRITHGRVIKNYRNGNMMDSATYHYGTPIGVHKHFNSKGRLRTKTSYEDFQAANTNIIHFEKYHSNGNLYRSGSSVAGLAYGRQKFYKRNGKQMRESDFFRGYHITYAASDFKSAKFSKLKLSEKITHRKIKIYNPEKDRFLRKNYQIDLKLKSEDFERKFLRVEGFINDSIVLTDFSYNMGPYTKNNLLVRDSTFSMPLSNIEYLSVASKRPDETVFWGAYIQGLGAAGILIGATAIIVGNGVGWGIVGIGIGFGVIKLGMRVDENSIHSKYYTTNSFATE